MAYEESVFRQEFEQKLKEVFDWAKANSPVNFSPDFAQNLDEYNNKLSDLVAHKGDPFKSVPEPEEGGPQYVSVSPAPWP